MNIVWATKQPTKEITMRDYQMFKAELLIVGVIALLAAAAYML